MIASRRMFMTALAGLAAASQAPRAWAQSTVAPMVVYDDELKNGWQSWSWAKVELSSPVGSVKPIKVEGDPWTALALHHDAFSTSGFTKLTFYINGGVDGGQTLLVKALTDGKAIDSSYPIQPKVKSWNVVEVPLKDIGADNKMIDGIWLQGEADAYKPYYITKIQFE